MKENAVFLLVIVALGLALTFVGFRLIDMSDKHGYEMCKQVPECASKLEK